MKQWEKPQLEEMSIKTTTQTYYAAAMAGSGVYEDLGTCHNSYWNGNGMSLDDAKKDNPYWHGGWGN